MACCGTILNKDITSNDFVLGSNDMLAILGYSHAYMNYTDNYLENLDISFVSIKSKFPSLALLLRLNIFPPSAWLPRLHFLINSPI